MTMRACKQITALLALAVILLAAMIFLNTVPCYSPTPPTVGDRVDRILKGYAREQFINSDRGLLEAVERSLPRILRRKKVLQPQSGWLMNLPSGRQVSRSYLDEQADPIILLGAPAVPRLIRWVRSEHLHVRYIAIHSLKEITGISPPIPHFQNGQDYSEEQETAIRIWIKWVRERHPQLGVPG
jgi:hypothetical protein